MVRQAIDYCKVIGISPIMANCSDDNIPYWKIIESFNGVLEDRIWDDEVKEMIRRYWIS